MVIIIIIITQLQIYILTFICHIFFKHLQL